MSCVSHGNRKNRPLNVKNLNPFKCWAYLSVIVSRENCKPEHLKNTKNKFKKMQTKQAEGKVSLPPKWNNRAEDVN